MMRTTKSTLAEAKQQLIDEYTDEIENGEPVVIVQHWYQMYGDEVVAVENEDGYDEDIVLVIRER
jgi:hypothetical protein